MPRYNGYQLKYYADENARYSELRAARITEDEALKAYAKLFRHFGLIPVRIEFVNGKRKKAHYRPGVIRLVRDWMNWKTLAHEFAHYWDDMRRRKQIATLRGSLRVGGTLTPEDNEHNAWARKRMAKIEAANWHGKWHTQLIDRVINYIKKKGWAFKPESVATATALATTLQRIIVPAASAAIIEADLRMTVFNALPEQMECPKCKATLPKSEFGVRVMVKDAAGNPVKVVRQSYCKPCRR